MARASVEESIAMGQEAPMKSKSFRALVSTFKRCTFRVQYLIAKQVPPPPSIPDSANIFVTTLSSTIDLSSNSSSTISAQKEHCSLMAWLWARISCWKGQSSGLPISIAEKTNTKRLINPIDQLNRDQEMGKILLSFVVPITMGVLAVYNKVSSSSSQHFSLILVLLSVGLTALWSGMLLRNTLPEVIANAIEQFGAGSIFFAFFSVLSSLLPSNLVWLPWTCFSAIFLPSMLSCIPVKYPSYDAA